MNRFLSGLKFVLVAASLVSTLSCASQNTSEKAPNVIPNNRNSNAASPAINRVAQEKKSDPKLVCAWLSDFTPTEYKLSTGSIYNCKSEKDEDLGGGKRLNWTYEPLGTATFVESIDLTMSSNNTPAVTQKAEARLVKMAETLWQNSYAKSLPNEIKNELLAGKGKPMTSNKDWSFEKNSTIPVNTSVLHTDAGQGISVVRFRFFLAQ